jgi:hypothetical protein
MNKPYKPRQKKAVMPVFPKKKVRIDQNTEIEVSVDISDNIARARYLERLHKPLKSAYDRATPSTPNMPIKPEFKITEIPIGDIEDLQKFVEDTQIEIENNN